MTKLNETIENINRILSTGWESEVSGNRDMYKVNISLALFLVRGISIDHGIDINNLDIVLSPKDFKDPELINRLMLEVYYRTSLLLVHPDTDTIKKALTPLSLIRSLLYGDPVSSGSTDQGRCDTSIIVK